MKQDRDPILEKLKSKLPQLAADTTTTGKEYYQTAKAYIKLSEQFYKVLSITDKYQAESLEIGKQLREAKIQAEQMALQAQTATIAKSRFLANMSHEIRTPMNGVIGMIELLRQTPLSAEQQRYADTLSSSGKAMLSLINDILDFSKIEAGKLEFENTDFDLKHIMSEALDILLIGAHEKGLKLMCRILPDVCTNLKGDPGRLRQTLLNLIGNAIKFTNEGKVEVEVTSQSEDENKTTLGFEIKDTGIGIPKNKIPMLFKAFEQLDNSNTRNFNGTGLGLAISKKLVELSGGQIKAESVEGKGSNFSFTWVFEKQLGQQHDKETTVATGSIDKYLEDISGSKILLAEDNMINQKVALEILNSLGFKADAVGDGQAVIDAIEKKDYDLVLMDIQMPVMDGFTATRKIRSGLAGNKNIKLPIIAMTANAMTGDRQNCIDAGMNDYIAKPITPDSLAQILVKWLKTDKMDD